MVAIRCGFSLLERNLGLLLSRHELNFRHLSLLLLELLLTLTLALLELFLLLGKILPGLLLEFRAREFLLKFRLLLLFDFRKIELLLNKLRKLLLGYLGFVFTRRIIFSLPDLSFLLNYRFPREVFRELKNFPLKFQIAVGYLLNGIFVSIVDNSWRHGRKFLKPT